MSLFMATDPIILGKQILGLMKWTLESHHKRQEDKSIIIGTYNAQNPGTNAKKVEKARRCQYHVQQKLAEQGEDIRSKAEMGILRPCTWQDTKVYLRGSASTGAATGDGKGFVHLDTKKRNLQRRFKAKVYSKHPKSHHKKIHFLSTSQRRL